MDLQWIQVEVGENSADEIQSHWNATGTLGGVCINGDGSVQEIEALCNIILTTGLKALQVNLEDDVSPRSFALICRMLVSSGHVTTLIVNTTDRIPWMRLPWFFAETLKSPRCAVTKLKFELRYWIFYNNGCKELASAIRKLDLVYFGLTCDGPTYGRDPDINSDYGTLLLVRAALPKTRTLEITGRVFEDDKTNVPERYVGEKIFTDIGNGIGPRLHTLICSAFPVHGYFRALSETLAKPSCTLREIHFYDCDLGVDSETRGGAFIRNFVAPCIRQSTLTALGINDDWLGIEATCDIVESLPLTLTDLSMRGSLLHDVEDIELDQTLSEHDVEQLNQALSAHPYLRFKHYSSRVTSAARKRRAFNVWRLVARLAARWLIPAHKHVVEMRYHPERLKSEGYFEHAE